MKNKEKREAERIEKLSNYDALFEGKKGEKGKRNRNFFGCLVKQNARPLLLSTLLFFFQTAPVWAIPLCSANIINLATQAVAEGGASAAIWKELALNVVVLLALIIQNIPSTVLRWRVTSKMLRRTSAGIKSSVIRKLQRLSITYHKDMQTGKIQSKFLKDTDSVDSLFHLLMFSLIPNVIEVLIAVAISLYKNVWVSLFFLLIIPFNVGLTFFFRREIRNRYRDYRLHTERMSMKLTTMLAMIPVTKAHGLEEKEIAGVEESIQSLATSGRKMDDTTSYFGSSVYVINTTLSAICLVFCAVLAIKGIIGVGDIVLFQSMFSSITGRVSGLINSIPAISSGFEALDSVSEIMQEQNVERYLENATPIDIQGNISFYDVTYRYPNTQTDVVKGFSLEVKAGECIAVVGSSGSGKSTLMNLIVGLLLPTAGKIEVDGMPISELNLPAYRHNLSVVPQNSILFDGSIRDNITYGLDGYEEAALREAVEKANLNEFVQDLPEGLDTRIGEHGDKLSGGQKQRVTIARALLRNPKILILDEATSALDNISEFHVQQAIGRSIQGRTTFIVAHRLSTIRNADRIVVMEGGEACEVGTYEELMAKKGRFYQLKQLNELQYDTAEQALHA